MKIVTHTLEESPEVLAIVKILKDGKPHKTSEIAHELGVSSNTARRYLHFMRDEMHLPIKPGPAGFSVNV